jgi:hypothetical protein
LLLLKNNVFCDILRVALVRTDVSEKRRAFIIRLARIGELGKTLRMEELSSPETSVLTKSQGVTSEKTALFIVTV